MIDLSVTRGVWVDVTLRKPTRKRQLEMDIIAHDFLCWSLNTDTMPLARGHSGPLGFSNLYTPRDARKVLAWLAKRGVTPNA